MLLHALLFIFFASLITAGAVQEDAHVFSSEESQTENTGAERASPAHPATAYWQITATLHLTDAGQGAHVQMLLPLSDDRQSVIARHASTEGARFREEADGLNLWGHWRVTDLGETERRIFYSYTVEVSDSRVVLPVAPFPPQMVAPRFTPDLLASPLIQSDAPVVRAQARELTASYDRLDQAVRALYDHTVNRAQLAREDGASVADDTVSAFGIHGSGRMGPSRMLVALLRAAGIPARVVGGIRLGDSTRKSTTISWVEALVEETWVPMDPVAGYFAWLPNTYLALYRGDLPLLIHTRRMPVQYTFSIRQLTRSAAVLVAPHAERAPSRGRRVWRDEGEHVHLVAGYVEQPRARVVLLHEGPVARVETDRLLATAQESRLDVTVLSSDFESSASQSRYLRSVLSNNMVLLREAQLLVVRTAGAAGFLALLEQGELGIELPELRILIASDIAAPVGYVLAAVLLRVLHPAEVVLVQQQADLDTLWNVARNTLLGERPLRESAAQQQLIAVALNGEALDDLSWWRRALVDVWTLAVQAHVPLPALNLILVLPLIAFFLVIIRNVIGLETFGTFSPMLLALAFLTTGLVWGLVVFVIIVGLGIGLRLVLQRLRLHLVSRVAILIAVVAVSMVGLTLLSARLGIGVLLHGSIFPMVIMANMIENFSNTQLERGTGEALRLLLSTLLVAVCSYVSIENTGLKTLVLAFPEILLAVIGIEVLLGRWRGLRLIEYVRFYALARHHAAWETAVEAGQRRGEKVPGVTMSGQHRGAAKPNRES